jgi:hypothetical protein
MIVNVQKFPQKMPTALLRGRVLYQSCDLWQEEFGIFPEVLTISLTILNKGNLKNLFLLPFISQAVFFHHANLTSNFPKHPRFSWDQITNFPRRNGA